MVIWGGRNTADTPLNDGARYDPVRDRWSTIDSVSLLGRAGHTAVWTVSEVIIWGGQSVSSTLNDGARYAPDADRWTPVATTSATARKLHSAVWTGSEVIVWGGQGKNSTNTGARYRPDLDVWEATATGAPSPRSEHVATWTGSEMFVWGGWSTRDSPPALADGGLYSPQSDSWRAPAKLPGQTPFSAMWTGVEVINWGGSVCLATGARHNPKTNIWTVIENDGALPAEASTAVWNDASEVMLAWGGACTLAGSAIGAVYSPQKDRWWALPGIGQPTSRRSHAMLWTGREILIWGGSETTGERLNTGGRYCW